MRYGLSVANIDMLGDVHTVVDLAVQAEEAGWDGFFLWDTIHYLADGSPLCDPWIALAAIAARTKKLRIGPLVTPLSRLRPWKLARETATLDHLSDGRLILGVGLGDLGDKGFTHFGEVTDAKERAELLDEGLDVLCGLWSGKPFHYSGKHYQVDEITFLPSSFQQPRIPIWVGGYWPRKAPMRRAAHWDGAYAGKVDPDGKPLRMTAADVREIKTFIDGLRTSNEPFDFVVGGRTPGGDPELIRATIEPFSQAGATWWLETIGPWRGGIDEIRARIRQGPLSQEG